MCKYVYVCEHIYVCACVRVCMFLCACVRAHECVTSPKETSRISANLMSRKYSINNAR